MGDQGSGIRDQGSGIRDQGSGIRDQGSGIRDQGLESGCIRAPSRRAQFLHIARPDKIAHFALDRAPLANSGLVFVGASRAFPIAIMITSHEDLAVWQLAMQLSTDVVDLTAKLPAGERFELTSQMRRAAVSIASNIAEGWARPTRVYINHLRIALGSEAELKTQLRLAVQMKYVTETDIATPMSHASEVGRMLRGLIDSLRRHLEELP